MEGKIMMNEKDMERVAIAAQYGTCNAKYLGEILDQFRIHGLDKQDMRRGDRLHHGLFFHGRAP